MAARLNQIDRVVYEIEARHGRVIRPKRIDQLLIRYLRRDLIVLPIRERNAIK